MGKSLYNAKKKREYYLKNKEKILEYKRKYKEDHYEDILEKKREHYRSNRDRLLAEKKIRYHENPQKHIEAVKRTRDSVKKKEYIAKYKKNNIGKMRALWAKRRALKYKATPKWLNNEQIKELEQIYKNRPNGHHVDHIVPLQGKHVCGLHVPWNLQYLPAIDNLRKRNKFEN